MRFKNWKRPKFDKRGMTEYLWMCKYPDKLKLGENTDIGEFCILIAKHGINIGENTQIGGSCRLYSWNSINDQKGAIHIGRDVLIGCNTTIMPNVGIRDGAEVYAHSFVRYNTTIEKDEIWAGIPAKRIGIRKDGKKIIFGEQDEDTAV